MSLMVQPVVQRVRPCPSTTWCACTGYCYHTAEDWNRYMNKEVNTRPECSCKCHEHPDAYTDRDCLLCGHRNPYVCHVEDWN
jgi:hypothetical protein